MTSASRRPRHLPILCGSLREASTYAAPLRAAARIAAPDADIEMPHRRGLLDTSFKTTANSRR